MRSLYILCSSIIVIVGGYLIVSRINQPRHTDPVHQSYYSTKSFFDDAFVKAPAFIEKPEGEVLGITVNHHLLAADIAAGTLTTLATSSPITIVLMSPNHNSLGKAPIITSLYSWATPYGVLKTDTEFTEKLSSAGIASVEETPFETEHGISSIVPFIKKVAPKAKVVSIILKDGASLERTKALAEFLDKNMKQGDKIIASLDFSHYAPKYVSDVNDIKNEEVLRHFDLENTDFMDIDSKPTVRTLLTYLSDRGAYHSDLLYHSSADDITGKKDSFENTSYINMAFSKGRMSVNTRATLLSFGDIMLDRQVRLFMNQYGSDYPFARLSRFMSGSDIVYANLEGPITSNPSKTTNLSNKELQFTFDPTSAKLLSRYGVDVVSLANNHTYNFGVDGFVETKKYLTEAKIGYFGNPYNDQDVSFVKDVRGIKIGFVGYHEFYTKDYSKVIAEIKRLDPLVDMLVVAPHWGIEYNKGISEHQKLLAHEFIDAGADVVMGAHPHVIEPIEIYKDGVIFYSLGNFIFDQDFSFDTTHGLAVATVVHKNGTKKEFEYHLFPLTIEKSVASLADTTTRNSILKDLAAKSPVSLQVKNAIINGTFNTRSHE